MDFMITSFGSLPLSLTNITVSSGRFEITLAVILKSCK
jgi:hypothetical protein